MRIRVRVGVAPSGLQLLVSCALNDLIASQPEHVI